MLLIPVCTGDGVSMLVSVIEDEEVVLTAVVEGAEVVSVFDVLGVDVVEAEVDVAPTEFEI
ncbi:hypothetical protein N7478_012530 [Penicillium angulare]|uniref:uncharacterized protein n=1 Tax=Penicillium angulare TaxID=116970 RepID=UPI002540D535|nr:uncharacterized protein N7478_012530 [Penicillium angulare]KAJ5259549.1 hypothetical protein N7478_012530 [Penicillium angulare]